MHGSGSNEDCPERGRPLPLDQPSEKSHLLNSISRLGSIQPREPQHSLPMESPERGCSDGAFLLPYEHDAALCDKRSKTSESAGRTW